MRNYYEWILIVGGEIGEIQKNAKGYQKCQKWIMESIS